MSPRDDLVTLSNRLGAPALDCVILGEGNTSASAEHGTFFVKGSGCNLETMTAADTVHLHARPILDLLDAGPVDEALLKSTYESAKVDPSQTRRPSVETVFHALLLSYPGVKYVGHTHPTAVNGLTCSRHWREALDGRLFPDEAVVLGPESLLVAYQDPGVVLARSIRCGMEAFVQRWGGTPKAIFMQNHGLIALGATPTEVLNITAMAVKACRIRQIALSTGDFRALGESTVAHILGRPDEIYRIKAIAR